MNIDKKKHKKRGAKQCTLSCCWLECNFIITVDPANYTQFSYHLKYHADGYITELKQEEEKHGVENISFCCLWRNCSWEGCEYVELIRHIMFHGYHLLLKSIGEIEQTKLNLPKCAIPGDGHYALLVLLNGPSQCNWSHCDAKFTCPNEFYRHVENHVVEHALMYSDTKSQVKMQCLWLGCTTVTRDKHKLKEHLRVHTTEKLIACPSCGGLFSNRTKFVDHLTRQNEEAYENFQCSHCLKRYASERLLRDHMRHHVNYLKCHHCDMTCPNPSSLREHILYRHSNDRPYPCSMCDQRFKSNSDLMRHEESHLPKQYFCSYKDCNFKTKTTHCLNRHLKIVHAENGGKRFVCHICENVYSRGFGLTKHLKGKHNFSWPSGHSRFRYVEFDDGLFRLQMVRFESAELSKRLHGTDDDLYEEDMEDEAPQYSNIDRNTVSYDKENQQFQHIDMQADYVSNLQDNNHDIDMLSQLSDAIPYCKHSADTISSVTPAYNSVAQSQATSCDSLQSTQELSNYFQKFSTTSTLTSIDNEQSLCLQGVSTVPHNDSAHSSNDYNSKAVLIERNQLISTEVSANQSVPNTDQEILENFVDNISIDKNIKDSSGNAAVSSTPVQENPDLGSALDRTSDLVDDSHTPIKSTCQPLYLLGSVGRSGSNESSQRKELYIQPKPEHYKESILSQLISLSTKTIDRSTTEDTPVAVMAADLYGRLLKNSNEISQNEDFEVQAKSSPGKDQSSYQVEVEVAVKIKKRNEHEKKETLKRKRKKKTVDLKRDNKFQINSKKQRTRETFAEESDGCTVTVENRSVEECGKASVTEARISVKATN